MAEKKYKTYNVTLKYIIFGKLYDNSANLEDFTGGNLV